MLVCGGRIKRVVALNACNASDLILFFLHLSVLFFLCTASEQNVTVNKLVPHF